MHNLRFIVTTAIQLQYIGTRTLYSHGEYKLEQTKKKTIRIFNNNFM